jgi:hypothetical protein
MNHFAVLDPLRKPRLTEWTCRGRFNPTGGDLSAVRL